MATNQELQDELKKKNEKIRDLEKQVMELQTQVEVMENQAQESKGLSGYVISTPSKTYNGVTMGVVFRNGRAIVLDSPEAPGIVNALRADFGYTVEHVKNLHEKPETAADVKKSMIDILSN